MRYSVPTEQEEEEEDEKKEEEGSRRTSAVSLQQQRKDTRRGGGGGGGGVGWQWDTFNVNDCRGGGVLLEKHRCLNKANAGFFWGQK